ncbi:MAG: hypothetical protein ACTHK2_18665 [Dokdonella sp.]|uniref:hypothetical protein n=1 Tax=Dokdonella sp. TaxID=2291710 RepID=UPI003F7E9244
MNNTILAPLALFAGFAVAPASAATIDQPLSADIVAARAAAAPRAVGHRTIAKTEGNHTAPGTPSANTYRAYPPSCAADPLPDKPSGPVYSINMPFWARKPADLNHGYLENVTVTVWRLPCSNSGVATRYNPQGNPNSITFMRVDRSSANEGHDDIYPTFPIVQVKQGSIDFTITAGNVTLRNPKSYPRVASEPNTVREGANYDNAIVDSTTFVLENFADPDAGFFSYGDAFTLRVDPNVPGSVQAVDIAVPAYVAATTVASPRPLDGYAAAQWINAERNEGLLVQVTEQAQPTGAPTRQHVFDLLTEDLDGNPLWLVGNKSFAVGQTSLEVDANYLGNGLAPLPYGTVKFEVRDCNHLDVTFTPDADLPAPIPTIEGPIAYDRLFTPNGMTCE